MRKSLVIIGVSVSLIISFSIGYALSPLRFSDIKSDAVYANSVYRIVHLGFMEGYLNGKFKPKTSVKRSDLAVVLDKLTSKMCFDEDKVAYRPGEGFYDGCNNYTCQDDGDFANTEMECETYGKRTYSWQQ